MTRVSSPIAAAGAVFLLFVAGCSQPSASGDGVVVTYDDGNTVTVRGADGSTRTVPVTDTTGTIIGQVLDDQGFGLAAVHVTVSGTDGGATTNATGWFHVADVAPGTRLVRAEADGYQTAQGELLVEAARVTQISLTLIGLQGGMRPHFHDLWRGGDTYTVYEGDVSFYGWTGCGTGTCGRIEELHLEPGKIVPPGTKSLTITFEFEPSPMAENGLEYHLFLLGHPLQKDGQAVGKSYAFTASPTVVEYEMPGLEWVDHGHATRSNWYFRLDLWQDPAGNPYHGVVDAPVSLSIVANKGTLVVDPPHPRYWQASDRIQVAAPDDPYPSSVGGCRAALPSEELCPPRNPAPTISETRDYRSCRGLRGCMVLGLGGLIPPGTTRVELELDQWWREPTHEDGEALGPAPDLVLGYRSAAVEPAEATWADYAWPAPGTACTPALDVAQQPRASCRRYAFEVSAGDADPFYTQRSNWVFAIGVEGHETAEDWSDMCSDLVCGWASFQMKNIFAINENGSAAETS